MFKRFKNTPEHRAKDLIKRIHQPQKGAKIHKNSQKYMPTVRLLFVNFCASSWLYIQTEQQPQFEPSHIHSFIRSIATKNKNARILAAFGHFENCDKTTLTKQVARFRSPCPYRSGWYLPPSSQSPHDGPARCRRGQHACWVKVHPTSASLSF